MNQKARQLIFFVAGLIVSIGFDQWTKALAVAKLKGKEPFVLIDGVFEFFYSENRGAAFGIMQGKQILFFIITAAVLLVVILALVRMPASRRYLPLTACLFLLASGAVGNMIDRVSQGYVVDFLYFKLIDFPIFNVADCYVVIATFLLIILAFFVYSEEELFLPVIEEGEGQTLFKEPAAAAGAVKRPGTERAGKRRPVKNYEKEAAAKVGAGQAAEDSIQAAASERRKTA